MLSRWYSIFIGILLLVMGIAGLFAPGVIGVAVPALVTTSIVWLILAVVALWFGFGVRNITSVRWFAGIVGGLMLLWGIIQMIAAPAAVVPTVAGLLASVSGMLIFLGALGLAAALVPAGWLRERETYAGEHAV